MEAADKGSGPRVGRTMVEMARTRYSLAGRIGELSLELPNGGRKHWCLDKGFGAHRSRASECYFEGSLEGFGL